LLSLPEVKFLTVPKLTAMQDIDTWRHHLGVMTVCLVFPQSNSYLVSDMCA